MALEPFGRALLCASLGLVGCHKTEVAVDAAATTYRVRSENGNWLPAIPREKGFRALALPGSGPVHLTWIHGATRQLRVLPQDQDYGGNYVARVQLRLERAGVSVTIDFGDEPGGPVISAT